MPSFADMLAYLRKRAGYSQTELADKLKISRSAIGMYESGKREPDFETLEALADTFNVNMDTLLGKASDTNALSNTINYNEHYLAPIVGSIPAGYPATALEDIEGYEPIPYPDTENYFFLRVDGDSMINAGILPGDLVLIKKQDYAEPGQIVACRVNGDEWGSRGRWFKSSHSDQKYREIGQNGWFPELFYEHIFLQNVL